MINQIVTGVWILVCAGVFAFIAVLVAEALRVGATAHTHGPTVQVSTLLERTQAPASEGLGRHAADETGTWMLSQLFDGDEAHHGHHWAPDADHTGELPVFRLRELAGAR